MCLDDRKKNIQCTSPYSFVKYGSENWTRDARDVRRITAADKKCISNTA